MMRGYSNLVTMSRRCVLLAGLAGLTHPSRLTWGQSLSSWQDLRSAWPKTEFSLSLISASEIRLSEKRGNRLPSMNQPDFLNILGAFTYLDPMDPAITLKIGASARAYPIDSILRYEIINDFVGGIPIAVCFSPHSHAFRVFDRRPLSGAAPLSFAAAGPLRRGNTLLFDQETETWWQQYNGQAIVGTLTGWTLRRLVARLESIGSFAKRSPGGTILFPNESQGTPQVYSYTHIKNSQPPLGIAIADYAALTAASMSPDPYQLLVEINGHAWPFLTISRKGSLRWREFQIRHHPNMHSPLIAKSHDGSQEEPDSDLGMIEVVQLKNGREQPYFYDLPFAFAFHAFRPNGQLHRDLNQQSSSGKDVTE